MALTENVEIRACIDHGCDGCDRFFQHLSATPQGRSALLDRYGNCSNENRFLTTPFVICAYDQDIGLPIGVCNATLTRNTGQLALLVDPEHQRQGHARRLVTAMLNKLKAAGATEIVANVSCGNHPSVMLARALGAKTEYNIATNESTIRFPLT